MTGPHPTDPRPSDDPWDRAHVIPDFEESPGWGSWLALGLIVFALLFAGFLVGRLTAEAAERQAAACIEGC